MPRTVHYVTSEAHIEPIGSVKVAPVVMQKTLEPDEDMANRFLNALTGSNDEVTYQFFDDKKKRQKLARWQHLKRNRDNLNALMKKQKQGCGVYVMVNEGDGKGRKAANVVKVRALFIDLDGSPWKPAAELLKPHIIVESSPERYHLYWLVSDCGLEQFKALQQAIAKKFNGDKACVDLSRVLRVPGFYHLKTDMPFMTQLVEVNDLPVYMTQQVIDDLGLEELAKDVKGPRQQQAVNTAYEYTDPITGEIIGLTAWAVKNPNFDIVAAIVPQYVRGEVKDGKQHIQCPFETEHTEKSFDLATFVANAAPPQYKTFEIHCMHAHCVNRDRLEFLLAMLQQGMLSADILQTPAILEKRPPKIYYPASEFASNLQVRRLSPEEFRVILHLVHISYIDNGTLLDDDWQLSRNLGMTKDKWKEYRETFVRTGWLTISEGKLLIPIAHREFNNAQIAYNKHLLKSSKGGKSSAGRAQAGHSSSTC